MLAVHGTLFGWFKPTTITIIQYIINHHSPQSKSSVILLAEGMLIWVKHSGAPEN